MSCLFCRIITGELPAQTIFEDETLVAFHDINPQAPVHVLVVPRRHIATLNDLGPATMPSSAPCFGGPPPSRTNWASRPAATARCSTATATPARPSITFTCTCWADDRCTGRLDRPAARALLHHGLDLEHRRVIEVLLDGALVRGANERIVGFGATTRVHHGLRG